MVDSYVLVPSLFSLLRKLFSRAGKTLCKAYGALLLKYWSATWRERGTVMFGLLKIF